MGRCSTEYLKAASGDGLTFKMWIIPYIYAFIYLIKKKIIYQWHIGQSCVARTDDQK